MSRAGVTLRVYSPAAKSYQTAGMIGELALMALSITVIRVPTGAF